ncbi:MAG: NAD(P)H-dependent oxidoreductase subunit E [Candidatus Omnitrophota bacterium]|jgi:bidirectional [NiFe] hydrogenase diaphorase subunit
MTKKDIQKDEATLQMMKDPRFKLLTAVIKKNQNQADALIQVLHQAQNLFGYLPMPVIRYITEALSLPPSQVYGVVTFYNFFSLKQQGEHTCLVCTGTACYVKGAEANLAAISQKYGIKPGETTPDNKLGLQIARCLGACGLAPVAVVDNEVISKVRIEDIMPVLEKKIGGNYGS